MAQQERTIKSLEKACRILMILKEQNGAKIKDIEAETTLSAGSVHTYLRTFEKFGFVTQDGTEYTLGPEFIPLGEHVRVNEPLFQAAEGQAAELAKASGGCGHIVTERNGKLLILDEVFGDDAIGKEFHVRKRGRPGKQMHCTAAGKAILAHLPPERTAEIIENHGLQHYTTNTITDQETLMDALAEIRERGYALNDEEQMRGLRAVGAPVLLDDRNPAGAVSVTGPANAWSESRFVSELPNLVRRVANAIEVNMQARA